MRRSLRRPAIASPGAPPPRARPRPARPRRPRRGRRAGRARRRGRSLAGDADPLVGTDEGAADYGTGGGSGATAPTAALPFGMVQPGPDTAPSTANFAGGYSAGDHLIRGFPLTHFSGAGCTGFRDVPLIPTTAAVDVAPHEPGSSDLRPRYLARFDHRHERARPGDYRVTLDPGTRRAVRTEVTATSRVAVLRLRFPRTRAASVLVDAGGAARANGLARVRVDPVRREVTGEAESGSFCFQPGRYRLFFAARFDRPLTRSGTWTEQRLAPGSRAAADRSDGAPFNWSPTPTGPRTLPGNPSTAAQAGAYATFDARRARTVQVRVALSSVGVRAARRTLAAEAPPRRSFAARARPRGRAGPGCWTASASRAGATRTACSWGRRSTTRSCTRARGRTRTGATAAWTAACTAPAGSRRSRTSPGGTSTAARSSSWRCSRRGTPTTSRPPSSPTRASRGACRAGRRRTSRRTSWWATPRRRSSPRSTSWAPAGARPGRRCARWCAARRCRATRAPATSPSGRASRTTCASATCPTTTRST